MRKPNTFTFNVVCRDCGVHCTVTVRGFRAPAFRRADGTVGPPTVGQCGPCDADESAEQADESAWEDWHEGPFKPWDAD